MKNGHDRFGVPDENIIAARKWIKKIGNKNQLFHVDVPTRQEVATLPAEALATILVGWMCNSPTAIIPSRTQIEEVRILLQHRGDADGVADLITMCSRYIAYS